MKFEKDERREFSTGAVRDKADGKGRYDLLPWGAIHAIVLSTASAALSTMARETLTRVYRSTA